MANPNEIKEFEEAAKPLMKFLNERGNPHVTAIVDTTNAEFLESSARFKTTEFVKD